ncbi:MAG: hypothetical protein NW216_02580 [Hyphomicrobium sp.]|nr:hypothetical protein [Hyphomicrobium sp.]
MSANLAAVLAIVVSLLGIALIASSDGKRRRAFNLPPRHESRALRIVAWLLILVPPMALLARQETAPIMLWLGALSVAGWIIAVRRPAIAVDRQIDALSRRLDASPTVTSAMRALDGCIAGLTTICNRRRQ